MASPTQQVDRIIAIWNDHLEVAKTLPSLASAVSSAVDLIYSSMSAGGQLLVAGNGGSAADAQHIAAELTGRFLIERRPFRALALHANTSSLTAVGNDYGYEHVFARELTAHARPGDVLLAISTSGNSPNILRAIEAARQCEVTVIGSDRRNRWPHASGVRPLFVRSLQIHSADAGDAYHDWPHNL